MTVVNSFVVLGHHEPWLSEAVKNLHEYWSPCSVLPLLCGMPEGLRVNEWRKFGNWDKTNRNNISRVKKQDRNYCIMHMWDLALLVGNYCMWSVTRSRVLLERSRDTVKWGNNGCVEIINRFHQRQGFGLVSLDVVIDDLGAQNRMQEWCLLMTQSWELFAGPERTEISYRENGVMLSVRINNTYGLKFGLWGLWLVPRNNEFGNREEERFECSNGSRDVSNHFMTVET